MTHLINVRASDRDLRQLTLCNGRVHLPTLQRRSGLANIQMHVEGTEGNLDTTADFFGFTKARVDAGVSQLIVEEGPAGQVDDAETTRQGVEFWNNWLLNDLLPGVKIDGLPLDVGEHLWTAGKHCMADVAAMDTEDIRALLQCDNKAAMRVRQLCMRSRFTRATILKTSMREMRVSRSTGSRNQTDEDGGGHPQSVSEWDIDQMIVHECSLLNDTNQLFEPNQALPWYHMAAGEASTVRAMREVVLNLIDKQLDYAFAVEKEATPLYGWGEQLRSTNTESQEQRELELQHALDTGEGVPGPSVAAAEAADGKVPDFSLHHIFTKSRHMILEMERVERLHEAAELNIVDIWKGNVQVEAGLKKNVVGVIAQVHRFCASSGCKYAAFSNYEYTWFVFIGEPHHLKISKPYKWDCEGPTLLEIFFVLSLRALEESKLEPWVTPRTPRKAARRSSNDVSGDGVVTRSKAQRLSATGGDTGDGAGASSSGGCSKQSGLKDSLDANQRDQSPAAVLPKTPHSALLAAAEAVQINSVLAIVGHGESGNVFLYMLNGNLAQPVALKVAKPQSKTAVRLASEGANLKAIKPLWGRYTPPLQALGPTGDMRAYILATTFIKGRQLNPATDRPLLPQLQEALVAVHQHAVLHGDLRPENVLVATEAEQQRVWLLDFGRSKQGASEDELREEMQELHAMFA